MAKNLLYLASLLMFFTSCEKVYTPKIETIQGQLVVEARITNDPFQNFVRLTKTTGFYSSQLGEPVSGATIKLISTNGAILQGKESITGYFTFSTIPEIGQNYKLQILYNNDTYESEIVTMPPNPSITDLYSKTVTNKTYSLDGFGALVANVETGRELYVDLPVTADLAHYRLNTRAVMEWVFYPPGGMGPPPPTHYGWQTYYAGGNFNLAGSKPFTQTGTIEKQPLMFLTYDTKALIADSIFSGWIVIMDQFGISQGSYDFHQKLNSQFSADGSLFDPIETQIYGNITCKTDPAKIAYGYFDLNSYRQYRYYLYFNGPDSKGVQREILRYPDIPFDGRRDTIPPSWWE